MIVWIIPRIMPRNNLADIDRYSSKPENEFFLSFFKQKRVSTKFHH